MRLHYITREKCTAYGRVNKRRTADPVWGVANKFCVSLLWMALNDAREAIIKRHLATRGEDSGSNPPFFFWRLCGAINP